MAHKVVVQQIHKNPQQIVVVRTPTGELWSVHFRPIRSNLS